MIKHLSTFEMDLKFTAGIWFFAPANSRFHDRYKADVELEQRTFRLPEIEACAGQSDGQLHADGRRQRSPIDRAPDFQGSVGAADAALAVDHQCDLIVATRDPPVGAQLAEGECEVARRVGGDRGGLADHGHTSRAADGGEGVLVGAHRIRVDQAPRHDEVLRDVVGVVLAERLELDARDFVELRRRDVLGQLGGVAATAALAHILRRAAVRAREG